MVQTEPMIHESQIFWFSLITVVHNVYHFFFGAVFFYTTAEYKTLRALQVLGTLLELAPGGRILSCQGPGESPESVTILIGFTIGKVLGSGLDLKSFEGFLIPGQLLPMG